MRVIGGRLKGRKLISFKADHIRPTTDRVKETVFNILMGVVEGSQVLDLFSGTGNLSVEAISRGAASVEAVEYHRKSLQIMRQNFTALGISDRIRIVASDVFEYLQKYQGQPYDLILIDPPFTEKIADRVMAALASSRAVGPQTVVTIEYGRHESLQLRYDGLFRYNERQFGDKSAAFFRASQV